MRKSRFSEQEIIGFINRVEAGERASDLCRELGVATQTFYRWRAKFGGMDVNEARRLRELEQENRRLKAAVAELTLEKQALKDVVSRKW